MRVGKVWFLKLLRQVVHWTFAAKFRAYEKIVPKFYLTSLEGNSVLERESSQPISTSIGNRKDCVCLHLHGHVSRQPKRCRSAMLDPKVRWLKSGIVSKVMPSIETHISWKHMSCGDQNWFWWNCRIPSQRDNGQKLRFWR